MGKFRVKGRALRTPKKADTAVEIVTPVPESSIVMGEFDLESSYLSVCCLLQTESETSIRLVNELDILSKMVDKLQVGTPKDIEETTLGALSSALGWITSESVESIVERGLVDFCQQVVARYVNRGSMTIRTPDRSCELCLDILCDLVQLSDKVLAWTLSRLDEFVKLVFSTSTTYPSVIIKRSASRLILALVERSPRSFVPGVAESSLTREQMMELLGMCTCSDLENRCYMIISGFMLESEFGASVVPVSASVQLDLILVLNEVVLEAATFTKEPNDNEELRLSHWRSRVRGLAALLQHIEESLELSVIEGIERTDDFEGRKFFISKATPTVPEWSLTSFSASSAMVLLDSLSVLYSSIGASRGSDEEEESETCLRHILLLEDRDLSNVLGSVGSVVKILSLKSFRIAPAMDNEVVVLVSKLLTKALETVEESTCEELLEAGLVCIFTFLLSVLSGKNRNGCEFLTNENLAGFTNLILKKRIASSNLPAQIVQLVFSLPTVDLTVKSACAETVVVGLSKVDHSVSPETACSLVEVLFVVFSESDFDRILEAVDWVSILGGISTLLLPDPSEYVAGTIANIKAFVEYKKGV